MSNRNLVKIFLLVALLSLSLMPFSQAHPKRGRKRAFGLGLMGGVLAGGAIGTLAARAHQAPAAAPAPPVAVVHHHYPAGVPAPIAAAQPAHPESKKMTVIETGTPDANGCYKQTVREPNPNNPKSYTETQHLICPTLQQANLPAPAIAPSPAHVPVMPQPLPVFPAHVAGPPPPAAAPVATVAVAPAAVAPAAVAPAAAPASVPAAVAPAPPVVVHPAAVPVAIPAPAPAAPAVQRNAGQPQVILLSKKTVYYPKKRSSAPTLNIPQGVLTLLVIFYSIKAFII
ncbi:nematocyst expressed protein 3-like [Drosophila biarmipes]|uniref:nematocyst expressed protein 3-like n=1 Tax=Drosophila biarmipes TaxID=125945 RepID=UPI0007E82EAA|nr:nematocyst expressed protein 3-like [Drosophila biarmipes]